MIADIRPDGEHSWDGHIWRDIEEHRNVTVIVSENELNEIEVSWVRQPDTEDILYE